MSLGYTTKVANADCKVYVGNLGLDFISDGYFLIFRVSFVENGLIQKEYLDILEFSRKLDVRKVNNAMYIGVPT